jgi:hypothetical protein
MDQAAALEGTASVLGDQAGPVEFTIKVHGDDGSAPMEIIGNLEVVGDGAVHIEILSSTVADGPAQLEVLKAAVLVYLARTMLSSATALTTVQAALSAVTAASAALAKTRLR